MIRPALAVEAGAAQGLAVSALSGWQAVFAAISTRDLVFAVAGWASGFGDASPEVSAQSPAWAAAE